MTSSYNRASASHLPHGPNEHKDGADVTKEITAMRGSTRREFLGASVALGALPCSLKAAESSGRLGSDDARTVVKPLAQEYTIAAKHLKKKKHGILSSVEYTKRPGQ